jgi:hypothetical protein
MRACIASCLLALLGSVMLKPATDLSLLGIYLSLTAVTDMWRCGRCVAQVIRDLLQAHYRYTATGSCVARSVVCCAQGGWLAQIYIGIPVDGEIWSHISGSGLLYRVCVVRTVLLNRS